jgi:NADPH-dependent curcumin reductase CurA
VRANRISYAEHVVEGFDHTVEAFLALFAGDNIGKLLVKV